MKKSIILLLSILSFLLPLNAFSQPIVSQAAPSISGVKMLDKDMPDLTNKFVFLHFWASWCGSESQSLEHLNHLAERYKDKVVFLAISNENEVQARSFIQGKQWNNIFFGLDEDEVLQKRYSVSHVPSFCFISLDNKVLATGGFSSEISDHDLDSLIIINDSTVLPNTTQNFKRLDRKTIISSEKNLNKQKLASLLRENRISNELKEEKKPVLASLKNTGK